MTTADIPPGGEGAVEVKFNTAHKTGKQSKTITITSDDPNNPTTRIYVRATIEVDFDFQMRSINFGGLTLTEPITKSAYLIVKDPSTTEITKITTSSPFMTAERVPAVEAESDSTLVEVAVTLLPGYPLGRINETVKAFSNLPKSSMATLVVTGKAQGDIDVIPDNLRFDRSLTDPDKSSGPLTVQVTNLSTEHDLSILSVEDPDDRLNLEVGVMKPGQKYEITATLKNDLSKDVKYFNGAIVISTDNPDQNQIKATYTIYNRK